MIVPFIQFLGESYRIGKKKKLWGSEKLQGISMRWQNQGEERGRKKITSCGKAGKKEGFKKKTSPPAPHVFPGGRGRI